MPITGNKGEWSEFYTFVKLLDERKLYPANEKLEINKDYFYPILKIFRNEAPSGERIYDLESNDNKIRIINSDNSEIAIIDGDGLKKKIQDIFKEISTIKKKGSGAFAISNAENMLSELRCGGIKAASNKKSDIVMTIKDELGVQPEYGYSIKSMIGGASTLFNPSGATNFIYKVSSLEDKHIEEANSLKKFKDKIGVILNNGGKIKFEKISSQIFTNNLQLIDNTFPQIMAELLLHYYQGDGNKFEALLDHIDQESIAVGLNVSKVNFRYKLKNFLVNVALGMVADTEWDSYMKAYGGYIIVKKDGELCCYQLNKRDLFQDYLYNNTKFETPSTGRFKYGTIYKEGGELFIKLNLQIRFIK